MHPAYSIGGFAAGMCNEHTGPALAALLLALACLHHRKGDAPRLLWAGGIGFVLGFRAIFFAPGQGSRYDGLAQQMSLVDRVIDHGIGGEPEYLLGLPTLRRARPRADRDHATWILACDATTCWVVTANRM